MASVAGKKKIVQCIDCQSPFEASLYADPSKARCPQCKKTNKKVNRGTTPAPVIHGVTLPGVSGIPDESRVGTQIVVSDSKPVKLVLIRNRQEIEGSVIMDTGEIINRVPTEWKSTKNELDYLSVSKIKAYEQCPAKFHRTYMSGDQSDNGNIFTWFGSILHEVVESSERMHNDNGIKVNPLILFDEAWQKQKLTGISAYKEARELILDYFARHPIGTNAYRPLVIDGKAAIEYEWRGPLGNVPSFGNMFDYIGEIDSETGIIKDYKSNRRPFTQQELEDDIQLQIYEIVARMMFPQYKKWITGFELFRFGWQQCPQRSQEDLDAVLQYVNNIWHQIQHDNAWEERLNIFCGYCDHRHTCTKYCDYVKDPKKMIDTIITDTTDFTSIERSRETYTTLEKILKQRKDELADMTRAAIEQSVLSGAPFVVDGHELYLQSQSRPYYDFHSARNLLTVHGKSGVLDNCMTINKTKLDAAVKSDPQMAMELQKCLVQTYTAPYIMKRKAKK